MTIASTIRVLLGSAIAISTATPLMAQESIKVGVPLALTGALADAGLKTEQGFDICVDAINSKGGLDVGGEKRPMELVKYDYQSNTNQAVQLAQRLINVDKVEFLFAPYGSGATKATAVVAARYGIPMMAGSAAAETVFDQNYPNLFGVLFPNRFIAEAEVNYYKQNVSGLKTVAVLALNDLYPKSVAADLSKTAKDGGLEVVYDNLYSPDTTDLSAPLTEIKSKKPDWIYITGYTQNLILARRQMADLGVTAKVVSMTAGPTYPEYADNLGDLANDVTSDSWWHYSASYTDEYLFGSAGGYDEAFEAKYDRHPTYLEAAATAGCEVLAQAIEKVGSIEASSVQDYLRESRFETFYGPIDFGDSGQNMLSQALVVQVVDGKVVILAPEDLKQGDLKLFNEAE
jgi:branched-chain amino acid transport system substrate-binding protein